MLGNIQHDSIIIIHDSIDIVEFLTSTLLNIEYDMFSQVNYDIHIWQESITERQGS